MVLFGVRSGGERRWLFAVEGVVDSLVVILRLMLSLKGKFLVGWWGERFIRAARG